MKFIIAGGILILAVAVYCAYWANKPDVPLVNSEAAGTACSEIPDNLNGFSTYRNILGSMPEAKKLFPSIAEAYQSRPIDKPTELKLKEDFAPILNQLPNILDNDYFFIATSEQLDTSFDKNVTRSFDEVAASPIRIQMLLATLAEKEILDGLIEEGISHIELAVKFGNRLQTPCGGYLGLSIGTRVQCQNLTEINKTASAKIRDDRALERLSQILSIYSPSSDNWNNATQYECNRAKTLLSALIKENSKSSLFNRAKDRIFVRENYMHNEIVSFCSSFMKLQDLPYRDARAAETLNSVCEEEIAAIRYSWILNPHKRLGSVGKILMCISGTNQIKFHDRNLAMRVAWRITETRIALLRYYNDNGFLPKSLDSLVPEYLASAPVDFMDGRPLRYDHTRGAIWSIGFDLDDNNGKTDIHLAEEPLCDFDQESKGDIAMQIMPK
jgi:hypothetical protein